MLRRHPWALQVTITGPPATPNQIAWLESGLTSMRGTGLTEREKVSVVVLLGGVVRHWAGLSGEMAAPEAGSTARQRMLVYGRALSMLTDPRRFPSLRAVLDAGVWDEAEGDDDDGEFDFSLGRVLDGIEALMRSRALPQ
jgi:hypothetical protein